MKREPASTRQRLRESLARGAVEIRTRGRAMRPLLEPGDRVRLEPRMPNVGDVALVEIGERLVLHRLVRRRGPTWWVRGESADGGVGCIHQAQIVAIATERLREANPAGRWLRLDASAARSERLRAWLRQPSPSRRSSQPEPD